MFEPAPQLKDVQRALEDLPTDRRTFLETAESAKRIENTRMSLSLQIVIR